MQNVYEIILREGRSQEAEALCTPISEIFELVGFNDILSRERLFSAPLKSHSLVAHPDQHFFANKSDKIPINIDKD